MKRRYTLLVLVSALAGACLLGSCKKKSSPPADVDGPRRFDSRLDGIAVRPLEPLDVENARRIIEHADQLRSGERIVPRIDEQFTAAETAEPAVDTSSGPAPTEPASSADYDDYDDANDVY